MRNLEGYPEIKVEGHNANSLRHADDTVWTAENKEDLQELLEESNKRGLELKDKKSVMVVRRNN